MGSGTQPDVETLVGEYIRAMRVARGWSQQQVAERMAVLGHDWTQTIVWRSEMAQRPLRLNETGAIALLFGTTLTGLLGAALEGRGCRRCDGSPPEGFTCNMCGRSGQS